MLTLFARNPSEFWRLVRSGFWNRLTKFFNNRASKTSARAFKLLYGKETPLPIPGVTVLRDDEVYIVVTILGGNVGIDGIVGDARNVQAHLDKFPGAFSFVKRVDELKRGIMGAITSPQIYTSTRSDKKWLM